MEGYNQWYVSILFQWVIRIQNILRLEYIVKELESTPLNGPSQKLYAFLKSKKGESIKIPEEFDVNLSKRAAAIYGLKIVGKTQTLTKRTVPCEYLNTGVQTKEYIVCKGYFSLKGPYLEYIARLYCHLVPIEYQLQRTSRDMDGYHITLISRREMDDMKPKFEDASYGKAFLADLKAIENNWTVLGLGKYTKTDNEAYFIVIDWPSGQEFLKKRGLPSKDFHITLGFKSQDIHDVAKDESTIFLKHEAL